MPDWIIPLVTLTAMEIVLGIDNIIFLTITAGRLPPEQRPKAQKIGLLLALASRLLLLFAIDFLLKADAPLFYLPDWSIFSEEVRAVSLKELVLLLGGIFLIGKSTYEIHHKLEGDDPHAKEGQAKQPTSFASVLVQIILLDLVFSIDSVITAVGMVRAIWVIVVAMCITVAVMLFFATPVSRFVEKHPTLKILALSFLILIGVLLVAEGCNQHLNKGYIYFAMAFSFVVEMINLRIRRGAKEAVHLREPSIPAES